MERQSQSIQVPESSRRECVHLISSIVEVGHELNGTIDRRLLTILLLSVHERLCDATPLCRSEQGFPASFPAIVFAWEPVRIGIYQSEELVQRRSLGMASSDFGNPLGYPRQASLATMHLLARRPQAQGQGLLPRTEAPFWGSEPICSQSLLVHCAHRRRRATQHELVLESRCQHPENRGACGVKRQLNPVWSDWVLFLLTD